MRAAARPRRSVLYLPGSNARALNKARSLPADCLILDLEDAVAPDNKGLARSQIAAALADRASFGGRELVVRVNSLSTDWGADDVQQIVEHKPDAILLPKAESTSEIDAAEKILGKGIDVPVWCMVETPLGVLRAASLAEDHRVECLVAGTSDLSTDLRCNGAWEGRAALLHSLSQTVLAARAHGKCVLDGVHLDIKDLPGFEESCVQGRALGFDGKTLIHPSTIDIANRVFAPSEAELTRARRVIEAFDAATRAGSALAVLDGKLVESLHVRESDRLLALGDAIAERVASQEAS